MKMLNDLKQETEIFSGKLEFLEHEKVVQAKQVDNLQNKNRELLEQLSTLEEARKSDFVKLQEIEQLNRNSISNEKVNVLEQQLAEKSSQCQQVSFCISKKLA